MIQKNLKIKKKKPEKTKIYNTILKNIQELTKKRKCTVKIGKDYCH